MSPRISIRLLSGQTDERLLALVREGHERAFEALVRSLSIFRVPHRLKDEPDIKAQDMRPRHGWPAG